MKTVQFEFEYTKDGQTTIVTKLPEYVVTFEELSLRVSVLRTNPKVVHVKDRLGEIDKTIKSAIELIKEWDEFQANFVYLNAIFVLEEIQKALVPETKLFLQV